MTPMLATEVRKQWSSVCDDVIRKSPIFIKRTRDNMVLANIDTFIYILDIYRFTAKKYVEDDGSITLSLDQIDLAENGENEEIARQLLGESILEYADEYYDEYELYHSAPNRRDHLPYVLKALAINDPTKIGGSITCQAGKN